MEIIVIPVTALLASGLTLFSGFGLEHCLCLLWQSSFPYGAVVSGFFGGLSGHQEGAFRSMFLLKAGLNKEEFVATGITLAVLVGMSRMLIYGRQMYRQRHGIEWTLVIAASLSAFTGAYFGSKLLKKITIRSIQIVVSVLLAVISLGLISGLL